MTRFFLHHPDGKISVQDGARAVAIPLDEWLLKADGYELPQNAVGLLYQGEAGAQRCKTWYADGSTHIEPGVWQSGERWLALALGFLEAEELPGRQREERLAQRQDKALHDVLAQKIPFLRRPSAIALQDAQKTIETELLAFPNTKKLVSSLLSLTLHLRDAVWPHLVEDALVPGATAIQKIQGGRSAVSLSWGAPKDSGAAEITGYEVAHKSPCGTWQENQLGLRRYHVVSGLRNGTAYQFRVRAVSELGEGEWSGIREGTPGAPPSDPQGFMVSEEDGTAELTWRDPASTGGYAILRWLLRIDAGGVIRYKELAATLREYRVTQQSGVAYRFQLAAENEKGISSYTDGESIQA